MARNKFVVITLFLVLFIGGCGKNPTEPIVPPELPVVSIKGFLSPTITFAIQGDTSSRMQQVYLCASPEASVELEFVSDGVAQIVGPQVSVFDQLITDNLCKLDQKGYRVSRMVKAVRAGTGSVETIPKQEGATPRSFTVKVESM